MKLFSRLRNRCRLRGLRNAQLHRAKKALEIREACQATLTAWPVDAFSYVTSTRLCQLKRRFESLSEACEAAATANHDNRRAPCHKLVKDLLDLQKQYHEITAQDAQWSQSAGRMKHEFRQVMREAQSYQSSVQDRIKYHERFLESHLARASRLLDPAEDCRRAEKVLREARKELEIPRTAVQGTRSLAKLTRRVRDTARGIEAVRGDTSSLNKLFTAATSHCEQGLYIQANGDVNAAVLLAERIENRVHQLVSDARKAQDRWFDRAREYPAFSRRFRSRIERVIAMEDPRSMLPAWDRLQDEIREFILQSACAVGNAEQQTIGTDLGPETRVHWSGQLDRQQLLRFARACSGTIEVAPSLGERSLGAG